MQRLHPVSAISTSSPLDNVETTTLIVLIMQEIPEVMEVNSSNSTKSDEEGRNDLIDDKEAEPTANL